MATLQRRLDRGRDQAERITRQAGAEIRLTRRGAGVSIRSAAASVGMSETMFGRIERGRLPHATVAQLAIASAAIGLRFTGRRRTRTAIQCAMKRTRDCSIGFATNCLPGTPWRPTTDLTRQRSSGGPLGRPTTDLTRRQLLRRLARAPHDRPDQATPPAAARAPDDRTARLRTHPPAVRGARRPNAPGACLARSTCSIRAR